MGMDFATIEEFEEYFFPQNCKKYPIKMWVTKEEADFIKRNRNPRSVNVGGKIEE